MDRKLFLKSGFKVNNIFITMLISARYIVADSDVKNAV